ncbi:MAG TPA: Sir2 family NAD-dependent protein deacetylase [Candidatus Polarisedimenticolia bacterium]|nr:Sir2 family NAD-dependent protein deacetylase [Candidatus Polarisedimenticolia bacterium]
MSEPRIPPTRFDPEGALRAAAAALRASRRAVALTGAGVSVESGVPPFRRMAGSAAGLWDRYDPMEYGTLEAFLRDPAKVWRMYREVSGILQAARPGPAHFALARLEMGGLIRAVITQNVDALHHQAGSGRVIALHGDWRTLVCLSCRSRRPSTGVSLEVLPPRCPCGAPWKPDVTLFGELMPPETIDEARHLARTCDLMVVAGCSYEADPAASLPLIARSHRALVIEVNVEETTLSRSQVDLHLAGPAGLVLPRLADAAGAPLES